MVTAPQFGQTSSNQEELANFRHAPFAKLTAVAIATISEEEAAQRQAAFEANRKEAKARKHAKHADAERRRQEARAKANAPRVTPPTLEGLKLVQSFIIRKSAKPPIMEISKDVLERGLELDREAEAARCAEERAQTEAEAAYNERLRVGYIHDVQSAAIGHLRREDINLEARILLLAGMGCQYSCNAKNGRDAVYFHEKSGAEILVRGGAIDDSSQGNGAKSPTSSVDRAKREAKRENNRAGRLAAQPQKGKGGQKDQPGSGKKKKGAK